MCSQWAGGQARLSEALHMGLVPGGLAQVHCPDLAILTCPAAGTQPVGAQPPCQTRRGSHTGVRAVTLCSSLMPSLGVPKPSNFLASTTGTAFCWATLSFHNADAPSRDVCHHTTPVFHRGCKLPASRTAPAPAAPMLSASDRAVAGLRLETISGGDTCLGSGVRSRSHGVCAF